MSQPTGSSETSTVLASAAMLAARLAEDLGVQVSPVPRWAPLEQDEDREQAADPEHAYVRYDTPDMTLDVTYLDHGTMVIHAMVDPRKGRDMLMTAIAGAVDGHDGWGEGPLS